MHQSELDRALQQWNAQYGAIDESLAIDGKTMRNAVDDSGRQIHIMGAVGQPEQTKLHPKKVGTLPIKGSNKEIPIGSIFEAAEVEHLSD